jgi:hypothetical protein
MEIALSSQPATELEPAELASSLLLQVQTALNYTKDRKRRFGRNATAIRLVTLLLSASSTVILGLQDLDFWASIAFSMVALTTLTGAIEPFFNWRSRWIVMEEMQASLHRLESDLRYFLAKSKPDKIGVSDLDQFHDRLQAIWASASTAWVRSRRAEAIEHAKA